MPDEKRKGENLKVQHLVPGVSTPSCPSVLNPRLPSSEDDLSSLIGIEARRRSSSILKETLCPSSTAAAAGQAGRRTSILDAARVGHDEEGCWRVGEKRRRVKGEVGASQERVSRGAKRRVKRRSAYNVTTSPPHEKDCDLPVARPRVQGQADDLERRARSMLRRGG